MTKWSGFILLALGAGAVAAQQPRGAAGSDLEPAVNTSAPVAVAPGVAPLSTPAAAKPAPAGTPSAPAAAAGGTRKPPGRSLDRLELEATQITGNRELPKVMYVVPWRRADLGDLAGRPANSLLDEALTPVDRDVFRRQSSYYQALQPDQAGAAPAPAR
jgi:hypothetical protein